MLSSSQLDEIKGHLENAGNPVFFFDNDVDGLCSFLLLARYLNRGKGIAIKSFPELDKNYIRKLHELNPDYVFILDKPLVAKEFLEEARKMNMQVVWIDHHDVDVKNTEGVYYYNNAKTEKKSFEPVTYICWLLTRRKEDLWLAVAGCIADNFMPDFASDFLKEYPELWGNAKTAFQALYETEIGKITRIMSFALKDKTSNVVKMMKFLMKVKSAREVFDENLMRRFNQIEKKYRKLLEKAKKLARGKLLFFRYSGSLSLSADIANELSYLYPEKIIVVAYVSKNKANVSLRGKNVKEATLKAISGLENATGGGHEDATGAKINVEDLPKFKERVEKMI